MAAPKAGGFKLSLGGAKNKIGNKAVPEKPAKKARLALGEDEPDNDGKQQEITGWDVAAGGAVELNGKKEEDKGPRIIPALPTRNWREEAVKRKLAQAGGPPGQQNGAVPENIEAPKMSYGLKVFKKSEEEESGEPEPMDTTPDDQPKDDGLTDEQRLEKNALEALMNGKSTDQTIIPIQSEEESFRNDIRDAPDAPTLEAYEATPIEGFGAALLRGMGWKDGEESGRDKKPAAKPKEIIRRPALLGIGAKPEAAVGIELGEWGKGKKKGAISYNPLMLKNKRTGEMITEEELKAKMQAQELVQEEKPSRSTSKYDDEDDERRREKRRERKDRDRRDDDYDSERRRDKDRRRDRDDDYSDRERRREKKKYRDDDYDDSDRRREKRRDRSRDDYDRREKGKERERRHRSRSPDSDERREKRRERDRRDRSRSRDSEDRRKRRRDYDDDDRDERKRRHKDDRHYKK